MKELLIETLSKIFGENVFLQGTLNAEEPYPDDFATFWTTETTDRKFYDNSPHSEDWNFNVILYSVSPSRLAENAKKVKNALKAAGFIPQGNGTDIASDRISHTGWVMECVFIENT